MALWLGCGVWRGSVGRLWSLAVLAVRKGCRGGRGKLAVEAGDGGGEFRVVVELAVDLPDRGENGGVVAVEGGADARKGEAGELASQVHGDVASASEGRR